LISLVLLAIAGTALITLLGQTVHSIESLRATEVQTRAAGLEVSALAALDRPALAARVGRTHSHGWSMRIDRLSANLFEVAVAPSDTGMVLLRTRLYRPDTVNNVTP
jgi:hypothetical protein